MGMVVDDRLEQWLSDEEEAMVARIRELVEIESVANKWDWEERAETGELRGEPYGGGCRRALDRMLVMGKEYGFCCEDVGGYCGSIRFGGSEVECGIWGHLDVVPAQEEEWVYPPFELTRIGDFLIGRGVQDNKGPLIAALWALRYLKETGVESGICFRLIFGCNEEGGMEDVVYYGKNRRMPDFSFVVDCSFPVCHGEKGIGRLVFETERLDGSLADLQAGTVVNSVPGKAFAKVKVKGGKVFCLEEKGISGHCAFPEKTRNALFPLCRRLIGKGWMEKKNEKGIVEGEWLSEKERKAVAFLGKLGQDGYGRGVGLFYEDEQSGRLTCNAGLVSMKDGCLRVEIDIRYPVTASFDNIEERLIGEAREAGFQLVSREESKGCYLPADHWLVTELMGAWEDVNGQKGKPYVMGGGTYARKLPNAVGFGPGQPADFSSLGLGPEHGGCHGADECQSLEALKQAVRVYVNAIKRLIVHFDARKEEEIK